jgi:hypothetical protein
MPIPQVTFGTPREHPKQTPTRSGTHPIGWRTKTETLVRNLNYECDLIRETDEIQMRNIYQISPSKTRNSDSLACFERSDIVIAKPCIR